MFFIYFFSFSLLLAQKNMDIFKLYPHFDLYLKKYRLFKKCFSKYVIHMHAQHHVSEKRKHAEVMWTDDTSQERGAKVVSLKERNEQAFRSEDGVGSKRNIARAIAF